MYIYAFPIFVIDRILQVGTLQHKLYVCGVVTHCFLNGLESVEWKIVNILAQLTFIMIALCIALVYCIYS